MTPLLLVATIAVPVIIAIGLAAHLYYRSLYAVPWLLLLGPAQSGKTTLVSSARDTASPTKGWFETAWRYVARQRGLTVTRLTNGVVIDVAAWVAFPTAGADLSPWRRLLRVLRRYRPRRPVDGVLLAIPAPLLLGGPLRTQDLGNAIRERLTEAQVAFGFVLPVYVVVTQSDELRGFSAFARAVPALGQNMLGWSNGHTASALDDALAGDLTRLGELAFKAEWIDEGLEGLHRDIVQAQVEVFASREHRDDAADLLAFSGELGRLANPLKHVLGEVFRPNLYRESSFLRGFYLCGERPRRTVEDLPPDASPFLRPAPMSAISFIDDLLERKAFQERGLAIPVPDVAIARLRGRLAAQVVTVVLAVGLAIGTTWSYLRLRGAQDSYREVLTTGRLLHRNAQAPTEQEIAVRLAQSRTFLERLQEVRPGRFTAMLTTIFMPASAPTERAVSREASRVFNDVVLVDMRAGLELRGRQWLQTAQFQPGDRQGPLGPALESTAPYRALDRFATEYQQFVDNYHRYDKLRRGEGASDASAPGELLAYLTSASSGPQAAAAGDRPPAPVTLSPTFARAVKVATAKPLNCDVFEFDSRSRASLVGLQASALLRDFGARSFGDDSPIVAATRGFEADWKALSDETVDTTDTEKLVSMIDDTTRLSGAVTAWAALGKPSGALTIPVFDRPPFKRLQSSTTAPLCEVLRPDLSAAIKDVEVLRDQLSSRLLAVQVEPFGLLLEESDKGLALTRQVAALKDGLDALQRESFWPPQPPALSGGLPPNPTWRPEAIDDVVKVFDAFRNFRGRAFGGLDRPQRDDVIRLVESEVAELVVTRLELTASPAPQSTDPETRLGEITRLGDERLAKLEPLIGLLSTQAFGLDILEGLHEQASLALQYIDRTASTRYPSVFARRTAAVFTDWTGVQAAAPGAEAVKRWGGVLDEQREGIRQLGNQARPLVRFLAAARPHLAGRGPLDVVQRWTDIAADVANFDQKRPSGFSALDAALRDGVPAMVAEKDCTPGDGASAPAPGFFATVRQAVLGEGVRRCRAGVEQRYATIAASFNERLSGRFPFSQSVDGAPEASTLQAAEFLRVFDEAGGRSLQRPLQALACSDRAITFMQRMDAAYALMTAITPAPAGGARAAAPAFALDVAPAAFRLAREQSAGGEQIVEWTVDIGRHTFRERALASAKPAPWTSGDPVRVTLRFARDSPHRPIGGVPFTRIEDRSVVFEFGGNWALFGLLRSGRAAAATQQAFRDAPPIVLGFDVRVDRDQDRRLADGPGPESPFKVFMRLGVFQPGKTDPLPFGELPSEAPPRATCPGA